LRYFIRFLSVPFFFFSGVARRANEKSKPYQDEQQGELLKKRGGD
jgi:hypothetical protein